MVLYGNKFIIINVNHRPFSGHICREERGAHILGVHGTGAGGRMAHTDNTHINISRHILSLSSEEGDQCSPDEATTVVLFL